MPSTTGKSKHMLNVKQVGKTNSSVKHSENEFDALNGSAPISAIGVCVS